MVGTVAVAMRWLRPVWFFVLLLALVACGAQAEPDPTPTQAVATAIAEPTTPPATRTPAPTAGTDDGRLSAPPAPTRAVEVAAGTAAEPTADSANVTAEPAPPATPACAEPGQLVDGVYTSIVQGPQRAYRVYLPPCYGDDDRLYPTLYLLHSNIRSFEEWEEVGLLASAETLIANGDIPPLIIVMPDGRSIADITSGGPYSYETVIVDELLPHVEETYCAGRHQRLRAIGGISRGGYWALEIAFRHPQRFASVGGHSASLYDIGAGPAVNPQYTGLENDLGTLRIFLDAGENDHLNPNLIRLHDDLTERGVPHAWRLGEGAHDDAYWQSQVETYLRWYAEPWQDLNLSVSACEIDPLPEAESAGG